MSLVQSSSIISFMNLFKQLLTIILVVQFANPAFAVDYSSYSLLKDGKVAGAPGSEFVSGATRGTVLMKVNIWGAVGKPGIHHVPARTNIISLLSYAGGPGPKALLEDVYIKRETANSRKKIEIDMDELISSASHMNIVLEPNDIVVVPREEPWVSQNTVIVVSLVSTVVAIIATGVIINNQGGR